MTITYLPKNSPQSQLSGLTPKQIQALPLVASGMGQHIITKKINITRQTLNVWKQDVQFQSAVAELRAESFRNAKLALSSLAMSSIQTLSDVLHNSTSDSARVKASCYILDQLKITETTQDNQDDNVDITAILTALGESNV